MERFPITLVLGDAQRAHEGHTLEAARGVDAQVLALLTRVQARNLTRSFLGEVEHVLRLVPLDVVELVLSDSVVVI